MREILSRRDGSGTPRAASPTTGSCVAVAAVSLRFILTVALICAVVVVCFPATWVFPAFAGSWYDTEKQEVSLKTLILTYDSTNAAYKKKLRDLLEADYNESVEHYERDHEAAEGEMYDFPGRVDAMYSTLGNDVLTFAATANFEKMFAQIYPEAASGDWASDFKTRPALEKAYALSFLTAAHDEAYEIPAGAWQHEDDLKDATYNAEGYRASLQARGQAYVFLAQEIDNARLDVIRQIDARARKAAEHQIARDRKFGAFEKNATTALPAQSPGDDYR